MNDFIDAAVPRRTTVRNEPVSCVVAPEEVYRDGLRWYEWEKVLYPSCTTMIHTTDHEGKQALKEWRKNVGSDVAEKITSKAADRGNKWHDFSERYLAGEPTWPLTTDPPDRRYGAMFAHCLDAKLAAVLATEMRVVSKYWGLAGRMDTMARLRDGRHAIIDYKTGRKEKSGNRLTNYGVQATFYSEAAAECMNVTIDVIVIVQLLPQGILWQESDPIAWRPLLAQRVEQFADELNATMAKMDAVEKSLDTPE